MIEILKHLIHELYNVRGLIEWGGTLMVCIIVFVETGMFVGFFLPGRFPAGYGGRFCRSGTLKIA